MAEKDKYADELLSDEELDQVAGGKLQPAADDSLYLNDILYGRPGQCDQYGKARLLFDKDARADIGNAWASVGVSIYIHVNKDNKYYYGGQEISRRRAYEIAWEKAGRNLNDLPPSWGY